MSKIIPERITAEFDSDFVVFMIDYKFDFKAIAQYWQPFHHLEAYTNRKNHDRLHTWRALNKALARCRGGYETVYSSMPPFGLARSGELVLTTKRRESARGRIADTEQN